MLDQASQRDEIENRTFAEIALGESASVSREITRQDIELFAAVSGDVNPAHLDPAYAETDMFHRVVAHGMLGAGLFSCVLGTKLPGPGTIYLSQDLRFLQPVWIGDVLTATVTVTEKQPQKGDLVLDCICANQRGEKVIAGTALVRAPVDKIRRPRFELPDIRLSRHERFRSLLNEAAKLKPVPAGVVHPCDAVSIMAAFEAKQAGLIEPVLIGPKPKILRAARAAKISIRGLEIIDCQHSEAAAAEGVRAVGRGQVRMLMKGSLHTDELLKAVLAPRDGLRTGRRLSHVYLMDVPAYPKPLLITDAAVNITPELEQKRDIVQNAIDLAHVMGIEEPRVAILSAVETITPSLRSTLDAAALCKMADRGQIQGGILDGPLAFDNAVSLEAAQKKGIVSKVAGRADILVVPDLEAGNMLAKQLTFLGGADAAGIVLGATVPIVLTSRADAARARIASCAIAALLTKGVTAMRRTNNA